MNHPGGAPPTRPRPTIWLPTTKGWTVADGGKLPENSMPPPVTRSGTLPDRLWVPALAGFGLALLFAIVLVVRAGGDVSLLVHAAPPWTDPATARPSLTVQDEEDGFDGQFFYRLGVAPWSTDDAVAGVTNDLPALRNARWGYGALAWAVSGGDPDLVPWSLVALNVVAAGALGAVGGGLARHVGRHAGWGVLFLLWPGFAYSLSLDTSELVASTMALGGLLAIRLHRWVGAAGLLAAAVLTRDTTLVIPAGVLAGGLTGALMARSTNASTAREEVTTPPGAGLDAAMEPIAGPRSALGAAGAGGVAVAVFVAWQLVQRARFGELPLTSSGDNNLSSPFGGLVEQLAVVVPPSSGPDAFRLISMIGLIALIVTAAVAARRFRTAVPIRFLHRSDRLGELTAWSMAVGVVVCLNAYLWSGATAFMRAGTEAAMLSILVLLDTIAASPTQSPSQASTQSSTQTRERGKDRLVVAVALGLSGLWLLTAIGQITKLA